MKKSYTLLLAATLLIIFYTSIYSQQIEVLDTLNVSVCINNNVILFYQSASNNYLLVTVPIFIPNIYLYPTKIKLFFKTSSNSNIAVGFDSSTARASFNAFLTTPISIIPISLGGTLIELNLNGYDGCVRRMGIALSKINTSGFFMLDSVFVIHNNTWLKIYPYIATAEAEDDNDYNYFLYQNYPNPFNPITKIKYEIKESGLVRLLLYGPLGQEIARLIDGYQEKGMYEIEFDASKYGLSSGVYFYQLISGNQLITRKMILIK